MSEIVWTVDKEKRTLVGTKNVMGEDVVAGVLIGESDKMLEKMGYTLEGMMGEYKESIERAILGKVLEIENKVKRFILKTVCKRCKRVSTNFIPDDLVRVSPRRHTMSCSHCDNVLKINQSTLDKLSKGVT